ncbi:MAG: dipicolinate synthase subunit B [Peptococcaceae bacterium]|nr:dipicolinate synthase subunit B [Peptococcaceae bacterium]
MSQQETEREKETLKIGWALTGSHCTLKKTIAEMKEILAQEPWEITPVLSHSVQEMNTKFGTPAQWEEALDDIGCNPWIGTIPEAEPIGPQSLFDVMVVAPCSGNTMAKLANGIVDTPALMAAKAHLRNLKPLVLGVSTNDGLGLNAQNIAMMLNTKNVYLVPFGQDDPVKKCNSVVFDVKQLAATIKLARTGKQIQPLLLQYH